MLDQGLCDISIEISHLENETQANTPETLLERVLKAVPYGDMACPRLNLALGIPAGTNGTEWKVRAGGGERRGWGRGGVDHKACGRRAAFLPRWG